jgi:type IV pilus biogenesis/stability protein PilW
MISDTVIKIRMLISNYSGEYGMLKTVSLLFAVIILAGSCVSVSENDTKNSQYHYQLGISYLNDNNIQPAFAELQKAVKLNPRDKEIHHALGVIYLTKLEDYPKAIEHFQEALAIDRNYSEAATNLGNTYANMKQYNEAIESYRMALSNPQYKNAAMALNNLGMVYYRLSNLDDAVSAFKEALKRYSDFHAPYYGLALCYNAKGQYGDAALAMKRAIELDPAYKGNRDKAIVDLRNQKLRATDEQEQDITDYLEIIQY